MFRRAHALAWSIFALAAMTALGSPAAASAQEMTSTVDRARMEHFVRAHIAINEARDEFHGQVARVHDPEGRQRAREEVEERIDAILEEHEMTRDDFDDLTLLISLDGELRAMFEEIMAELTEGGGNG